MSKKRKQVEVLRNQANRPLIERQEFEKKAPVYHPLHSFILSGKQIELAYSPDNDILEIVVNKIRMANIAIGNETTEPKLIEIK
jgi:hypothetical protein